MNGYKTYCLFLALKNHFRTESYDFIKYKGKVSAKVSAFDARRDKYFFEKLATRYSEEQLIDFFVANILKGRKHVVEMIRTNEDESKETYLEYVKRKESFTYYFDQDIDRILNIVPNPKSLFRMRKNSYPEIVRLYLTGIVDITTLVVLDDFTSFSKVFDDKLGKDEYLWSDIRLRIMKTRTFVKYDQKKIERVMRKMLNNE